MAAMNAPEGEVKFVPKQALAPSPQLYDELVSDSMENLAKASLTLIPRFASGATINDNGCGRVPKRQPRERGGQGQRRQ